MVCAMRGLRRSAFISSLIAGWGCNVGHLDIDQTPGGTGGLGPVASGGMTATGGEPADCAGKRRVPIYRDEDGDGSSVGNELGVVCEGSDAPPGYSLNPLSFGGADCDDADPTQHDGATLYYDGDGDGFGVPSVESRYTCRGTTIPGFAPNALDCDDTNPKLHRLEYRDQDHDGFGAESRVCVDSASSDYALQDGDCDDVDPARYPYAVESALDGVDSNCDGLDAPARRSCGDLEVLDPAKIVPAPACAGKPDLFVAALNACADCLGAHLQVMVGNRGDVAARAELVVYAGFELGLQKTLDLGVMEAGSLSPRLDVEFQNPQVRVRVQASGGAADCAPNNDAAEVLVGFVDCLR